MIRAHVICLPDFQDLFVVKADASEFGLGAMLMQNHRPISYFNLMAIVLAVQRLKHYFMGRPFLHDVSMDYQIWLTKLLGFDFEIIYKAGVENKAADGLSRIKYENQFNNEGQLCALTVSLNLQMQEVIEKVDSDHEIQQEIQDIVQGKAIKKGHLMIKKGYSINKGRLFYKGRLVLSRTSKSFGVLKTIKRIQRLFHLSKLKDNIQYYVSECTICQTTKYSTLNHAGILQLIPLPTVIRSEISMEFIDSLPKFQGFSVTLVVVDRISKYAHFIGLEHP
ncbi:hypothetical protein N665_0249s0005 [Sinapis alba]|nr:hypothetical protein N665_0249s0005 [Sinapis alba]